MLSSRQQQQHTGIYAVPLVVDGCTGCLCVPSVLQKTDPKKDLFALFAHDAGRLFDVLVFSISYISFWCFLLHTNIYNVCSLKGRYTTLLGEKGEEAFLSAFVQFFCCSCRQMY